jgi:hypothetical protein
MGGFDFSRPPGFCFVFFFFFCLLSFVIFPLSFDFCLLSFVLCPNPLTLAFFNAAAGEGFAPAPAAAMGDFAFRRPAALPPADHQNEDDQVL